MPVSDVRAGLVAAGWHLQLFKAHIFLVGIVCHGRKIETIVKRGGNEGERIRDSESKEKKVITKVFSHELYTIHASKIT